MQFQGIGAVHTRNMGMILQRVPGHVCNRQEFKVLKRNTDASRQEIVSCN